jgi:hypothetical protein
VAFWIPVTKTASTAAKGAGKGAAKTGELGVKGATKVGQAGARAGARTGARGARAAADAKLAKARAAQQAGRVAGRAAVQSGRADVRDAVGGSGRPGARGGGPGRAGAGSARGGGPGRSGSGRSGGNSRQDKDRGLGARPGRRGPRGGGLSRAAAGLDPTASDEEDQPGDGGGDGKRQARRRRRWFLRRRRGPFKKYRRRTRWLSLLVAPFLIGPLLAGAFGVDDRTINGPQTTLERATASCPADLNLVAQRIQAPAEAVVAYCLGATRYQVDWTILAGIGKQECDHGRSKLPGCTPGTHNSCGARGPMQFLGNIWRQGTDSVPVGECPGIESFDGDPTGPAIADGEEGTGFATDGDANGVANPWTWPDAGAAAARYLAHYKVNDNPRQAIARYNSKPEYIEAVLANAARYKQAVGGLQGQSNLTVGNCPGTPQGDTSPVPAGNNTMATQTMANTLLTCFGRNGHGVGCYDPRTGDGGRFEHPRGRACDFMMTSGGVAGGNDKDRGTAMAEYTMANAAQLNVLYIIWFNKVWSASRDKTPKPWSQWRSYGCGDCGASGAHYNHVHVSVKLMPGDPALAACRSGISCSE